MSDIVEVINLAIRAEIDCIDWTAPDNTASHETRLAFISSEAARASLAALEAAGYAVVPVEPTREMETPAIAIIRDNDGGYNNVTAAQHAAHIYAAMLKASKP